MVAQLGGISHFYRSSDGADGWQWLPLWSLRYFLGQEPWVWRPAGASELKTGLGIISKAELFGTPSVDGQGLTIPQQVTIWWCGLKTHTHVCKMMQVPGDSCRKPKGPLTGPMKSTQIQPCHKRRCTLYQRWKPLQLMSSGG